MRVNPAPLTVTVNNTTSIYGSTPAFTVSYSGFVNGDGASKLTRQPTFTTTPATASDVGAYPVTASGASDPNYTFTYLPGTLTIGPAPLTVTANNLTGTYGTVPTLTASYSGLVNGDDPSSLSTAPSLSTTALATSTPGIYPITVSGPSTDGNYTVTYMPGR